MDIFEISTDNGEKYNYYLDQSNNTTGYSMYTLPIVNKIESTLKIITKKIIDEIYLTGKDYNAIIQCNMEKEDLIGKYFDKDGFVYFSNGNQLNKFNMKIKYFEKIYRNNRNGK